MQKILSDFEITLQRASAERASDGLPQLAKVELKVLGQMALFANEYASASLDLVQTKDLDAIIEGDWVVRSMFKETLRHHGLVYDDLSDEIWIPPEATFDEYYNSSLLRVLVLSPLYVLVSKAVKAPEKNKQLITQAISVWGESLIEKIEEYGQDVGIFL